MRTPCGRSQQAELERRNRQRELLLELTNSMVSRLEFQEVLEAVAAISLGGPILRTLADRSRNEAAPVLVASARMKTKRIEVSQHGKTSSTAYYAIEALGRKVGEGMEIAGVAQILCSGRNWV